MRDVAREADVGITTVSRVINSDPTVQSEYVERVLAAVAKLGFRRDTVGRNLRTGRRSATIGLVVEDLRNPFYSLVAYEIEQVARSHDALLITSSSEEDPARERELVLELCQRDVDGLVIVPTASDHSYCRAAMANGMPMVFLDREPNGIDVDTAVLDNFGGATTAVRRLIDRDHRRIAVIGYKPDVYTIAERVRGFRAAMAEAEVPIDRQLLRLSSLTPEQAADDAAALLDIPEPPTAFFCCNNRMTIGVLEEIRRRLESRAPSLSSVDVAGFDDIELSNFLPMPITLVVYDITSLARRAAELLFRRLRGHDGPPQHTVTPTHIVTRGRRTQPLHPNSTGEVRVRHEQQEAIRP